jgi:hypothetical protein
LLGGAFVAVLVAYVFTEFLLRQLDVRRRVLVGEGWPLGTILGANLASFMVIWVSSLALDIAAGLGVYYQSTIICLFAQGIWLSQHLWFYHRDHLRLRYE